MALTLAFDVYGTLIDTHGVVTKLHGMIGEQARAFSTTWRTKQLEYSFRRALMRDYISFPRCTQQALDYACLFHGVPLNDAQKHELMEAYRVLPAFDDVTDGLTKLNAAGHRLFAFSNGTAEAVTTLLKNAGIFELFAGVVSVENVQSFKPDPAVYQHFIKQSDAKPGEAWMVSSNPFDVIGAMHAGLKAAWIQRSDTAVFDPWGVDPTVTVEGLMMLAERLTNLTR